MTYHLDERPSPGHFTSPFPHFLNVSFRQNGSYFSTPKSVVQLITRTIILKTTLFEFPLVRNFVQKIVKNDYESPYCYLTFFNFIHNSRSFPSKK